ncbi:MAG: type II toxin-antitoxin system HipA family toxin, partial [Boseongicola sp. SB0670_bin_30]|nr:type II toxin-antitoxin system HipA family toxin [Boseongicola sp. SB0670_bin_30]
LLPSERHLAAIARRLGLSRLDSRGILERSGGDVAGALSFGAPVPRPEWDYVPLTEFYGEPDPGKALERHFEDLRTRPFLVGEDGVRLSLAGGQEKSVLAVLDADGCPKRGLCGDGDRFAVPLNGAPSTVIVKPDNPRHLEGIVENEAYCLSLASAVGIEAVEAGTLQAGARSALAVVRYDRAFIAEGSVRRLHQEDFAQALGVLPTQKYERGPLPGPSLKDILGMGGKDWAMKHGVSSGLSGQERSRILDQVIFNVLVANTDAHAKNYALLLNGGHARLTPLYDVSCALPWKHIDQNFAQKLAGKKRRPGDVAPRHWDAIARDSGFNASHVRERVVRIADRIFRSGPETASKVAAMPGVHLGTVNLVRDMVQSNALRIMGRIESSARSAPRPVSVQGDHDLTLG